MSNPKITRRSFLAGAAAAAAAVGCTTMGQKAPAKLSTASPNSKLNIAGVGVGGKGFGDIMHCNGENIVAICDVDDDSAAKAFNTLPNAKRYKDYRKMLEEMKEIDAVTVSTPDHMHFPVAMLAISMGKHVYVQKPLTHTVWEARQLQEAARKHKVKTQMGNQGHSGDGVRELCEMVWSGAIGNVKEVYTWTDRPIWPQGMPDYLPEEPVRATIDWDLWQGVAPRRPYNKGYAPFVWRGWWDYGCGALGDMACHIMDPANWALKLYESAPTSVEVVEMKGISPAAAPTMSTLKYEFPARGDMPPVTLYWYDGYKDWNDQKNTQNLPPRPAGLPENVQLGDGKNGSLFIGDKGMMTAGTYGGKSRLLPDEKMADYKRPAETLPRVHLLPKKDDDAEHKLDWLNAIKNDGVSDDNFDYACPFTEYVVLGNLALRTNSKIEWDAKNMKVTNVPEANKFIKKDYPKGWF